jgi:hypothetical protein
MKTTKLFSVLSLVLIFASVNVLAGNSLTGKKTFNTATIRYEVNIHFVSDKTISNIYWVQVTDENGRPVSPPQTFVQGKSNYTFFEMAPARGTKRIAMLILSPYLDNPLSMNLLYTQPDVLYGPFLPGQSYSFNLVPVLKKNIKNED